MMRLLLALLFCAWPVTATADSLGMDDVKAEIAFADCARGDAKMCLAVGKAFGPDSSYSDLALSAEAFQMACDLDEVYGCANLGDAHYYGRGVDQNYEEAFRLYATACDGDAFDRCGMLGYMYKYRQGTDQDLTAARLLSRLACQNNFKFSCGVYGEMVFNGEAGRKDKKLGLELFKIGCEGEDAFSCRTAANILNGGFDMPVDQLRARDLAMAGCKLQDAESCELAGDLAWFSRPGEFQVPGQDISYLRKACELGRQTACTKRDTLIEQSKNAPRFEMTRSTAPVEP